MGVLVEKIHNILPATVDVLLFFLHAFDGKVDFKLRRGIWTLGTDIHMMSIQKMH